MKLALIQMKGTVENDENIAMAVEHVRAAAAKGADMVVLPEMFSCPYKVSNFPVYAQKDEERNWQALSAAARDNGVYLVAGSMPEECEGKIYNTSYAFDRNGKQIAKHRKMHLFDCDIPGGAFFHESETLTAGNSVTTFDTEFGTMGLMICFDIRFPELSRLMCDRGAKLVIVPAAFNMTSGPAWWEIMFRTRSADNQFFMAGCAPARDETASYVAYGHSIVTDPFGKILGELEEKPGLLFCDLDLETTENFRSQFKILKSRRLDVYSLKDISN